MHARRGGGNRFDVVDAFRRLENGVDQDRLLDGVPGLELRQELIEIVNIPRSLDLRQHDDVELVADARDDLGHIIEHPRRIETVDARPHARRAEVVVAHHLDEALARVFLLIERHRVLEIAEHDVDLGGDTFYFGADLVVMRRHEMDHALELDGKSAIRLGRARCEGREMLSGRACRGHRRRSYAKFGKDRAQ